MDRIFIIEYGSSKNWIMHKIADDIQNAVTTFGYECRCGEFEDYQGEEICYHIAYAQAVPIPQAKHNSLFYTHINDKIGETLMVKMKDQFDSFVCMSEEDVEYLLELGFEPKKVYGKTLPVRNTYIKPLYIGIFSACYSDGRKNEQWLLDYCKSNKKSQFVNFVFIGRGWGDVVKSLEDMGCSYEWHNVSSNMPFEYQFQQNKLSSLNYYIYMGMDGGAMGTYDAYAQDIPLCVTYDGFHKSIPSIDYKFDNKETFFDQLNIIVNKHYERLLFYQTNNRENYVKWLINVWSGNQDYEISKEAKECLSYDNVLDKKRDQYYRLSYVKLKFYLRVLLKKMRLKRKISNG